MNKEDFPIFENHPDLIYLDNAATSQRPKQIIKTITDFYEKENANIGSVVITPCFHGYGTTLGNALRRVLLSSLPGSAVEHFKIKGAQHEFSTIEGIKEDVVEIMLNLMDLRPKLLQ